MNNHFEIPEIESTVILLIDMQERLIGAMPESISATIANQRILLEAAKLLNIRVVVTEQYPKGLGVTADNIANVNTAEFKKSRATLAEGASGAVQVNIERVNTPGYRFSEMEEDAVVEKESSNVQLEEELPQMMITRRSYEANLKALQTYDEMLGSVLDITG